MDAGDTWHWPPPLDAAPYAAGPWVDITPDGTAHVAWSQPAGPFHAWSANGGRTWQRSPERVHDTPLAAPGDLVAARDGTLAARIIPDCCAISLSMGEQEGNDGVRVSRDGGVSWTYHELIGERNWNIDGDRDDTWRVFDPLAYDSDGVLYVAWGTAPSERSREIRSRAPCSTISWRSQRRGDGSTRPPRKNDVAHL